jgi:2-methylisocitrate lyase-like PEP mutase family enzyme
MRDEVPLTTAEAVPLKVELSPETRKNSFPSTLRKELKRSTTSVVFAVTLGLDEAIRRGRMFAAAGADVIFIESPETEAEMAAIGKAIDKPLLANMVEGGRTPILPAKRLAELGYAMAIYPAVGFLAAQAAENGISFADQPRHEPTWASLAHALITTKEFIFVP